MKYGIRTCGQVGAEGPTDWPALTVAYQDDDVKTEAILIADNFTLQSEAVHTAYVEAHQAEYDTWAAEHMIDALILDIRDRIDAKTDELIDTGITYQGMHFKLDLEHQNSYMFDYLLNQTFPHTIKGIGEDYITFVDHDEFTQFIGYGFGSVDAMIRNGWTMKDDLVNLTYAQLLAWTDPR